MTQINLNQQRHIDRYIDKKNIEDQTQANGTTVLKHGQHGQIGLKGLFLHSMILESDVNSRPLLDGIHFENIRFILAMQDPQAVGQKSSW